MLRNGAVYKDHEMYRAQMVFRLVEKVHTLYEKAAHHGMKADKHILCDRQVCSTYEMEGAIADDLLKHAKKLEKIIHLSRKQSRSI